MENNSGDMPKLLFNDDGRLIDDEESEDEALAGVLASLGRDSDASVGIYRQGPGGYRDLTYLTECLPSEYSLSRLQDEFGGGVFRIHVRNGGKLVANKEVKVAPPPNRQAPPVADVTAPLQKQLDNLAGIVGQLAQVVTQQQQRPASETQSRKEFFQEMLLMKQMFGGAPRERDPFDMLTKMMTLQKELGGIFGGGGSDVEPGSNTLLLKAIETFGPILTQANQNKAVPTQPMLHAPATDMQQAPSHSEEANMLKIYLNMLIAEAKNDIDPQAYALLITQKVARADIDGMLRPDDWFEKLSTFEPAITPFREWFADLRADVFELLTEQDAVATTGGGQPGDAHHVVIGTTNANTGGNT